MARTPQSTTIDGVWFEVRPLGFAASRQLFVRLTKALGPALLDMVPAQGKPRPDAAQVLAALGGALERLTDADLEYTANVLGEVSKYSLDGGVKKPLLNDTQQRETLFTQTGLLMFFQWLAFALEVEYAGFFAAFKAPPESGPPESTPSPSEE